MTNRACPQCDAADARVLIALSAGEMVTGNTTYQPDALKHLGLNATQSFPIGMCQRCGFVYSLVAPSDEFLEALYNQAINPELAAGESQSTSWVAHQIGLASGLLERVGNRRVSILDYGCGHGTVLGALRGPNIKSVGYEIGANAASYAAARGFDVRTSLEGVRMDAPYDGILLSDVLEHVLQPRDVLRTCHDLLSAGAWMCVSVPDFSAQRMESILADRLQGRPISREVNPWEHLNYFSPESLTRMVRGSGFAVEQRPAPDFGFRHRSRGLRRLGNAVKSAARLLAFALRAQQGTTTVFAQRS
jgi:2-polyprenyl-3-methyl-5-hydroxy-6-metoxy-1,4-benzoquinol methylase